MEESQTAVGTSIQGLPDLTSPSSVDRSSDIVSQRTGTVSADMDLMGLDLSIVKQEVQDLSRHSDKGCHLLEKSVVNKGRQGMPWDRGGMAYQTPAHTKPQPSPQMVTFPMGHMLPPIRLPPLDPPHTTPASTVTSANLMRFQRDFYNLSPYAARRRSMDDTTYDKDCHRLVYIASRKPCVWCQINRVKTKSGWYCYASYRCVKCDVPLCKQGRDCFMEYHRHIGVPLEQLVSPE